MSINLDKIDLLKERANVSYREAKEALEANDGDLVEALIYLEEKEQLKASGKEDAPKQKKRPAPGPGPRPRPRRRRKDEDFERKAEDFFKNLHNMRFKVFKKRDVLLNIPATVAILIGFFTIPFSVILLVAAVVMGYHVAVIKPDGKSYVVDEEIRKEFQEEFGETRPRKKKEDPRQDQAEEAEAPKEKASKPSTDDDEYETNHEA